MPPPLLQAAVACLLRNDGSPAPESGLSTPSEHGGFAMSPRRSRSGSHSDAALGLVDANVSNSALRISTLAESVIGRGLETETVFGRRVAVHTEYRENGRFLAPVEDFVRDAVLPWFADGAVGASSHCARITEALVAAARQSAAAFAHDGSDFEVSFVRPGAVAAAAALAQLLGMKRSAGGEGARPLVLISEIDDVPTDVWAAFDCDVLVRALLAPRSCWQAQGERSGSTGADAYSNARRAWRVWCWCR
jgi:hypothetical protein